MLGEGNCKDCQGTGDRRWFDEDADRDECGECDGTGWV